jgi:hypothetical protein
MNKGLADAYAANVLPVIREIRRAGATSLHQVAEALNARGISTPRGGQWYGAGAGLDQTRSLSARRAASSQNGEQNSRDHPRRRRVAFTPLDRSAPRAVEILPRATPAPPSIIQPAPSTAENMQPLTPLVDPVVR